LVERRAASLSGQFEECRVTAQVFRLPPGDAGMPIGRGADGGGDIVFRVPCREQQQRRDDDPPRTTFDQPIKTCGDRRSRQLEKRRFDRDWKLAGDLPHRFREFAQPNLVARPMADQQDARIGRPLECGCLKPLWINPVATQWKSSCGATPS
jgi:hypothetical protein